MLKNTKWIMIAISLLIPIAGATGAEQTVDALATRVAQLEAELSQAKADLQDARSKQQQAESELEQAKISMEAGAEPAPSKIQFDGPFGGTWQIGGAVRVNYVAGDYSDPNPGVGGTRGDSGTIALDIFRVNVDYENGNITGKFEYRFYPGYRGSNQDSYQFPHTAWIGYALEDGAQVQAGINRVPFGPGAYGISQSWFFDQHYYLGLTDDMDLGIKYTKEFGDLRLDLAYYFSDEGSWVGEYFSSDSVRYSYDVVNESGQGYEESNQVNLRLRKSVQLPDKVSSDLGISLQYGQLDSKGVQEDGEHYAASVHAVTTMDNWKLATQLTRYAYDVDADQPMGTDKLVQFGAFDFATLVAARAWVAGASLSYYHETKSLPWLDYVIPYAEFSTIIKDEDSFNDSDLVTLGAAWGRGGWYIYTEAAWSNGNDFVGNLNGYGAPGPADLNGRFASNRFGTNPNDEWQYRINLNFGYYY